MSTITLDIVSTTLDHLLRRRENFFRSIERDPDNAKFYNEGIDKLNIAIEHFESERERLRH